MRAMRAAAVTRFVVLNPLQGGQQLFQVQEAVAQGEDQILCGQRLARGVVNPAGTSTGVARPLVDDAFGNASPVTYHATRNRLCLRVRSAPCYLRIGPSVDLISDQGLLALGA